RATAAGVAAGADVATAARITAGGGLASGAAPAGLAARASRTRCTAVRHDAAVRRDAVVAPSGVFDLKTTVVAFVFIVQTDDGVAGTRAQAAYSEGRAAGFQLRAVARSHVGKNARREIPENHRKEAEVRNLCVRHSLVDGR